MSTGHDMADPIWSELTRAPTMNLIVGLEHGLWRRGAALSGDLPDQSALRLLDALAQTSARMIVTTAISRVAVDMFRVNVPGVVWCADGGRWGHAGVWRPVEGDAGAWITRQLVAGPSVAIGGSIPLARFANLAPYEVGFVKDPDGGDCVRRVMSGPSAVRAFLWWLTQERDAHRRRCQVGAPVRRVQLPR